MYIHGLGFYAPERVVENKELSATIDTSDEWIRSRTGIAARRMAAGGQDCSDLAVAAARAALASSGLPLERISHILVATVSGDAAFPATACVVQTKLGLAKAMSFDIGAACSGFLYGMEVARGMLAIEPRGAVLLVGAEIFSRRVDWQDRSTCVLFGDGAGAAVISLDPALSAVGHSPARVDGILCESGRGEEFLYCLGGGTHHAYRRGDVVGPEYFVRMNGLEVFKHAVRAMTGVSLRLLERIGCPLSDIDLVVPHQANMRIIKAVLERLGLPESRAYINVDRYGNTSAASVPMALAEAEALGLIRPGFTVLLTTFGAGFTWASAVLRY